MSPKAQRILSTQHLANALLVLDQVSLNYGDVKALKHISLNISTGEHLAIIGPNGAGKTSFFDMLAGFYKPASGQLWLNGIELNRKNVQERARLGLLRGFQRSRLFKKMNVLQNLQYALSSRCFSGLQRYAFWVDTQTLLKKKYPQPYEQMLEMADAMGFTSELLKLAGVLSYADQRLLELAMMLLTDAKVLLLDEPAAGLSQKEFNRFIQQLNTYAADKTILFTEHDMTIVKSLADRVLVLWDGEVIVCDTPDIVFQHPQVNDWLAPAHGRTNFLNALSSGGKGI